jgi:hypothetical protein
MAKPKKVTFVACPVCDVTVEGKELGEHIRREHAAVAWRQYVQTYLGKMWFGQGELDKLLVESFKNSVTCEMLSDLFSPKKYGVARTLGGSGPDRYKRFADMLNSYRDTDMTRENIPGIIEREVVNLREVYDKGPLSAITKSLWMMKQHPIVIYDGTTWEDLRRRAARLRRRDLAPGYTRYGTYFDSWFKFFDDAETQKGLDDALSWLPESPAAKKIVEEARAAAANSGQGAADEKEQAVAAEIRTLAASQLMRNRVADMRMFYEGGWFS